MLSPRVLAKEEEEEDVVDSVGTEVSVHSR